MLSVLGIVDNPQQSLFTYGLNGDFDSYFDLNFVPAFEPVFTDPELEQQAQSICGNNKLCIFDIAATGDVNIGSSTMKSVEVQAMLREQFVQSKCGLYFK